MAHQVSGVGAAASAAERLRRATEERLQWMAKRRERLARKHQLLKLLKLEGAKENGATTPEDEADNANKTQEKDEARKKELKQLQERAKIAQEKQQQASIALEKKLQQLKAVKETLRVTAMKRKREEDAATEQPEKKTAVEVGNVVKATPTVEMPPFAAAENLDIGTPQLASAACFRIAMRYLVVTGTNVPRRKLEQAFKIYTGRDMDGIVDQKRLELSLAYFNGDNGIMTPSERNIRKRWQPGRQFLEIRTFSSGNCDRLQALIEAEKQVVADVCSSLGFQRAPDCAIINNLRLQTHFLSSLLDGNGAANTLSALLAACVGIKTINPVTTSGKSGRYRSHRESSCFFLKMESWLRDQAENSEPNASTLAGLDSQANGASPSSKYAKPFSLENDSVVNQLKLYSPATTARKRLDPMRLLCHYELNGVCNDKNCSFYHRSDYDVDVDDNGTSSAEYIPQTTLQSKESQQLLLAFAEFRSRITAKWPVITGVASVFPTTTEDATRNAGVKAPDTITEGDGASGIPINNGEDIDSNDGFVALDDVIPLGGLNGTQSGVRYYEDTDAAKSFQAALQKRIEENPTDADAWLLLAIDQLELNIGESDDAIRLSNNARLHQQLVLLCQGLNMRHPGSPARGLNVEEEALKRSLHTLSRAVEVEENAYCETLWLLYLHLSDRLSSKQDEVEAAEQAVQFLPRSQALWFYYISAYDFASVNVIKALHWRILHHIANMGPVAGQVTSTSADAEGLSRLLLIMSLHLCVKLWRAGEPTQVLKLLSALLQLDNASSDYSWCDVARGKMCHNELIGLYLVFAHVVLFSELPDGIGHWIGSNSNKSFPLKELAYSIEYFQDSEMKIKAEDAVRALQAYEFAFGLYESEKCEETDVGDTILNNWALVIAYRDDESVKIDALESFLQVKLHRLELFPAALFTAAKVLGMNPTKKQQAERIMAEMLSGNSEAIRFPKILHYFLFACRQFPALLNALDGAFPNVMERLASLLGEDTNLVEKSVQDFNRASNRIAKSTILKTLLNRLLATWMDQLASFRSTTSPQEGTDIDIYVALDICHLMSFMLEPSVAIDSLQMVMSTAKFGSLSLEARQLTWVQRFVFQLDLMERNDGEYSSWRGHQENLIQLFRKYLSEMNTENEMLRQVSTQLEQHIDKNAVQDAVMACLYPERSELITFDASLELFRLCCASVIAPEKAAFFASCTDALSFAPAFSLNFGGIACHEWELLAARASLRRCLAGPTSTSAVNPDVLQALVAVELRLRNMKAVSNVLETSLQKDPLVLETWRLVLALEIVFGERSLERAKAIAKGLVKCHLTLSCNMYGDAGLSRQKLSELTSDPAPVSLNLRGLCIKRVPNSVQLLTTLVSLDISGNELTDLPDGVKHLKCLEKLNASENALFEVPEVITSMAKLKELNFAHNNLRTIPIAKLTSLKNLEVLDIRWNAVSRLPIAEVTALKALKVLNVDGNLIPTDGMVAIANEFSSRRKLLSPAKSPQTSECNQPAVGSKDVEMASSKGVIGSPPPENPTAHASDNSMANDAEMELAASEETHQTGEDDNKALESGINNQDTQAINTLSSDGDATTPKPTVNSANGVDHEVIVVEATESVISVAQASCIQTNGEASTAEECSTSNSNNDSAQVADEDRSNDEESPNTHIDQPAVEVIDVDASENEEATESQTQLNNITDLASSVLNGSEPSTTASSPCGDIVETFIQNHNEAATAAAARQKTRHEGIADPINKLMAYMEENHIENRAQVRDRNPALWQEFVSASLPLHSQLGPCRLCRTPNDGRNQRLNTTVLCVDCLKDALEGLQRQSGH